MVREGAVPTSQTAVYVPAGYNMNDLTQETINVSLTLMGPFLPQLLLPSPQPFILLEKQILPAGEVSPPLLLGLGCSPCLPCQQASIAFSDWYSDGH